MAMQKYQLGGGVILNKFFLSILFLLLLNSNAFAQANYNAKVIKIRDGDSFIVQKDKIKIEIRLSSIDAPEYFQDYGKYCKNVLSELIYLKNINVKTKSKDKYGRTIAKVFYKNTNINQEIVKRGCAWAYIKYLDDKSLIGLERRARKDKIGLWASEEKIIAPWKARNH